MNLYRKHRPQNFSEIIGQKHISETLLKQLQSGKISHAYLFSGPRGTGKTSTARIFAKALNCKKYYANTNEKSEVILQIGSIKAKNPTFGEPCNECENCLSITKGNYLDVIEIDAASNRGIDEIRDLREKINLAPTSGKFKVYIIDEAHQLTNEAFNALLKTLEEPPAHAVFILATTEPQKIPATIASRVQKYDFGKAINSSIEEKLKIIKKKDSLSISDESLVLISSLASGSYRDAEVLLDKILSVNPKAKVAEVEALLGKGKNEDLISLLNLMLSKKTRDGIIWLESYFEKGGNSKVLLGNLIELLREVLLLKVEVITEKDTILSIEAFRDLSTFSKQIPQEKLANWIALFTQALADLKDCPIPSLPVELAIVEACEFQGDPELEKTKLEPVELPREEKKDTSEVKKEKLKEEVSEKIVKAVKVEPKKVNHSNASIEMIQKKWPQVLQNVKPHNNSLEIFLRAALPVELDNDLLIIEVNYGFHKDRLEETKNSAIIAGVISEILGRPVRIKGRVGVRKVRVEKQIQDPLEETDPVEIFGKLI